MKSRNLDIDLTRGCAMLAIAACHGAQLLDPGSITREVLSLGQLGCQVFFFYTGFFLMKQSMKNADQGLQSIKGEAKSFLKRVGKIAIPYYCMILIYLVLSKIFLMVKPDFRYITNTNIFGVITNGLFLNGLIRQYNNNVVWGGWYTGTLVLIWVVYPFILRLHKKMKESILIIGAVLCVCAMLLCGVMLGSQAIERNSFLYFSVVNQLPCVIAGSLYCILQDKIKTRAKVLFGIIASIAVAAVFYSKKSYTAVVYPMIVAMCVPFYETIICQLREKGIIKGRAAALLAWCGENSLYIFLSHILVVWYLHTAEFDILRRIVDQPTACFYILALPNLALVILTAWLFKWLCDKTRTAVHGLKLGKRS